MTTPITAILLAVSPATAQRPILLTAFTFAADALPALAP